MVTDKELLSDEHWEKIEPLLPTTAPGPKGGRPKADNRLTLTGIIWVLRSGARWKDLPDRYPSPATCWRRLKNWEAAGIWTKLRKIFLRDLDVKGAIDWEEAFMDGSFAPAKNGGDCVGKTKKGKGTKG
ncbi:MAG: IS5 family transposase [Deltaproteobacteria bacterium]|nr:IS5 family transposase [Deltaproteobacteria bacterium]